MAFAVTNSTGLLTAGFVICVTPDPCQFRPYRPGLSNWIPLSLVEDWQLRLCGCVIFRGSMPIKAFGRSRLSQVALSLSVQARHSNSEILPAALRPGVLTEVSGQHLARLRSTFSRSTRPPERPARSANLYQPAQDLSSWPHINRNKPTTSNSNSLRFLASQ